MSTQLSEKKAKLHIVIIGIFYIISGILEYLLGLTQLESIPSGTHFFLDIYRNYLCMLGLITILVGLVFFPAQYISSNCNNFGLVEFIYRPSYIYGGIYIQY